MSWATVARFSTLGEAEIACTTITAAGIETHLADEDMVAMNWLYSDAVGGVKLLVPEEDLERAAAILDEKGDSQSLSADEDFAAAQVEEAGEADPDAVTCPACGNSEIARVPRLKLFVFLAVVVYASIYAIGQSDLAVAAVIVLGLITLFAPSHRCLTCGEKWIAAEPTRRNVVPPGPEPSDTIEEHCPRCGSPEFYRIDYRRLKAVPLLASITLPFVLPAFLFLPKRRCDACGLEV